MDLSQPLQQVFHVTPRQAAALKKLGIATVRDLLFYFPARYESFAGEKTIDAISVGERVCIKCTVVNISSQRSWKKRMPFAEGTVQDKTGLLRAVWFRQPYVAKMLNAGSEVQLTGRVARDRQGLYLANPAFSFGQALTQPITPDASEALIPVYPETWGISSRWLGAQVKKTLEEGKYEILESIPEHILARYRLPKIKTALRAIHFPKTKAEAEAARKRFAFEEVFSIQLLRQQEKKKNNETRAPRIEAPAEIMKSFVALLPFALTTAQERAIADIFSDFKKPHPMARLLEGDVGSGKTVVAAAAALATVKNGQQATLLAPTEILARQHFQEFITRFSPFRVPLGLLTSSGAKKFPSKVNPLSATPVSRNQLLRWVASGEIKILIGTHALIEDRVKFKNLALAVVDEQHRFGTLQRQRLRAKNHTGLVPHFLSMTATPIPRTLALTLYGDLDLSLLDEMPAGRKPVATKIVNPHERETTYAFIKEEIRRGGQAFVICPRIEEKNPNESGRRPPFNFQQRMNWSDVKSAKAEYKKLAEHVFPDLRIGMLHGRLTPNEKEVAMQLFRKGKTDILVATSVVEVGVDIPNASIMVIEGGERFGLATLHQFRGRVGRKGQQAYCFVFTTADDDMGVRRLKALEGTKTGFELAEYDLRFRGPGELSGRRQWGISDMGMEAVKNIKMVEAARTEAYSMINEDPDLKKYPLLQKRVMGMSAVHFE